MKKIGFYNYYDIYNKNRMFETDHAPLGDNLLYPSRYLAEEAKKKNIQVSTIDTEPLESYDAIIFLDFPTFKNKYFKKLIGKKFENMYLFIFENELIRPDNWNKENYRYFKSIYTWNDEIVDNNTIFKFFIPNRIPANVSFDTYQKNKFCCMIAGNKSSNHKFELYSERVRAIRWFENNAPQYFDLYGQGWNEYSFSGPLRLLNRVHAIKKLLSTNFPSYRGAIASKAKILRDYKFSICYENAYGISGYITEKIFDCFFSGCVPIYWGAKNILDFIPKNTFIDRREFKSYDDLFFYLKNLSGREYQNYLKSIEQYVNGPKIFPFSAENFSNMVLNLIIDLDY